MHISPEITHLQNDAVTSYKSQKEYKNFTIWPTAVVTTAGILLYIKPGASRTPDCSISWNNLKGIDDHGTAKELSRRKFILSYRKYCPFVLRYMRMHAHIEKS